MIISTDPPVVVEAIWRGWVQRGRANEHSSARKTRVAAGILLVLGIGVTLYLRAMK
jgi:hypothetical protein